MAIPQHLILKADLAKSSNYVLHHVFSELQAQAGANLDDRAVLVLLLLAERARGKASPWVTYISNLPSNYGMQSVFQHLLHQPHRMLCYILAAGCSVLSILWSGID